MRDRRERRVRRLELFHRFGRGPVQPRPAGPGEALVERVLDQCVREDVAAVALVDHDLGRDRVRERGRDDGPIGMSRRGERRDVEPATEDAGRREHAPGVFCEQLHPAADGRADVAGKLRIRHRTRRYGHQLGIRLGRKGPTSENGRLVRGTSGILAARPARGHVRAGSGRARRAQTSGAARALAARAGSRRLRRPAHRPAVAR